MREPAFWWREAGFAAALLTPLAAVYGAAAARRMARPGQSAGVPVICVGNFTLGGAGKTPTALMLARMLGEAGERVFCLSRGYGGAEAGPRLVDAHNDRATAVGDEALLLARVAPTIVSPDRVTGAALARAQGASVIVMDDGLQNSTLNKDFTLAVIDGQRGIGNGKVFPAGPLRAPIEDQLTATDAMLVVGEGEAPRDLRARAPSLPIWHGRLVADLAAVAALRGRRVLAFAGIGNPEKFFVTARAAGLDVAQCRAFPDHHRFSAEEAAALIMAAEHAGLALLTTEKDRARMAGDPLTETLAQRVHVLPVELVVAEHDELRARVLRTISR